MGILVTLRILKKQTRKKMKLLILSVLVAYALCECPEVKDPECKGSDLRCGQGDTDSEGCPMQEWCMHVDPYAHCSAKAMCPRTCDDGVLCKGDIDDQGCAMPDSCWSKNTDGCPDVCNQPCDARTEEQCPTPPDSKGCQRGATCAPKDPMCPTRCPAYCNENEMCAQVTWIITLDVKHLIPVSQRTQNAQHIAQNIAEMMKICAPDQLMPTDAKGQIHACQGTPNAVQCVLFIVQKDRCSVPGEPIGTDAASLIHAFLLMKKHPAQQNVLWPVTQVIWSVQEHGRTKTDVNKENIANPMI